MLIWSHPGDCGERKIVFISDCKNNYKTTNKFNCVIIISSEFGGI